MVQVVVRFSGLMLFFHEFKIEIFDSRETISKEMFNF